VAILTDEVRSSLNLDKDAQGLYVTQVIAESPAAIIGIQRGDRITAVNDTQVKDLQSYYKVLREKSDKELWFSFIRGNNSNLDSLKYRR
jgi:serine protease Do